MQISMPTTTTWSKSIYLNPRLRYNYLWFGETNVRHIRILLPVLILTIITVIGMLFCTSAPNCIEIGLPAAE